MLDEKEAWQGRKLARTALVSFEKEKKKKKRLKRTLCLSLETDEPILKSNWRMDDIGLVFSSEHSSLLRSTLNKYLTNATLILRRRTGLYFEDNLYTKKGQRLNRL